MWSKSGHTNGWSRTSTPSTQIEKTTPKIIEGKFKFTWEEVRIVRAEALEGVKISTQAKRYGVSTSCVRNIVKGKTWKENEK
tara:strand:- start:258 stop:503 length:246 start_codon:yes stop_codon:yes gene_type:complete